MTTPSGRASRFVAAPSRSSAEVDRRAGAVVAGWSWPAGASVMANDNTTGNVWDGDLREMNNPLPRWWMWLFVITVVFGVIYLVLLSGPGQPAPGLDQRRKDRAARRARSRSPAVESSAKMDAEHGWPRTRRPMAIGERLFLNNCAPATARTRGQQGLPEPDRQRLAGGGRPRPSGPSPTAAPASCRRWRGAGQ